MAYEFKLPDLGEGLTEAEIARWLVAEGAHVAEDQPLVEVQTDKTTVEIPSPREGTVLKILVEEGEIAPVGAVLVVIGEEGEQLLRAVDDDATAEHAGGADRLRRARPTRRRPCAPRLRCGSSRGRSASSSSDSRAAGPGVGSSRPTSRLPRVRQTGRGFPCAAIRRTIGEQVTRAHREIPAVTFVEECDFTGVDVSRLVAHTIRAVASAVVRFPELNARLEDDEIVLLDRVDVGVAVQTDDGLVVPVVRGCSGRSVEELDADVRRLADGARAGSLGVEELRDSTITITSAGKLGGLLVTPLVNYPEVAIVGLHRIVERPVVRDGQIVVRSIGNVSVTFDHRVVDGVRAAAFCLDVIEQLQSGAGACALRHLLQVIVLAADLAAVCPCRADRGARRSGTWPCDVHVGGSGANRATARRARRRQPLYWSVLHRGVRDRPVRQTDAQGQAIFHRRRRTADVARLSADRRRTSTNVVAVPHPPRRATVNGPVVDFLYGSTRPVRAAERRPLAAGRSRPADLDRAAARDTAALGARRRDASGDTYVNVHTNDGVDPQHRTRRLPRRRDSVSEPDHRR